MGNDSETSLGDVLRREAVCQLAGVYLPRMKKCLSILSEEEIWRRPNENTVSVGNLTLHLCGNVRQWVVSGLGDEPDIRKRSEEFSEQRPIPAEALLERLEQTIADARRVIEGLSEAELVRPRKVQDFEVNGVGVLLHVVEHFSYHLGQITYFVKTRKNIDTGYYAGVDLEPPKY